MLETFVAWEVSFLHGIQQFANDLPGWDEFWTGVTMFGESGIFWIVLSLILMVPRKTRRLGFSMGLALLIGLILCNGVLKNVVARPRPYDFDPTLFHRLAWGEMSTDFSFPSGHTTASFEAAFAIFLRNKKWGIATIALAVLIGISRLCLVVHYPSDVVAGALCGALFAYVAARVVDALWRLYDRKKAAKVAK